MQQIVHDPDRMRALVVEARAAGRLGSTRLIDHRELRDRGPFAARSTPDQGLAR